MLFISMRIGIITKLYIVMHNHSTIKHTFSSAIKHTSSTMQQILSSTIQHQLLSTIQHT